MEYWKHLGDLFLTVTIPQIAIGGFIVYRQWRTQQIVKDGFKALAMQAGELKATKEAMGVLKQDKDEAVKLALRVPPEEKK